MTKDDDFEARAVRRIYSQYKARAKKKKTPFVLSLDEFWSLIISRCRYCGASHSNSIRISGKTFVYNGVDRKDSSEGYTPENSVACCRFCNSIKGPMKWQTWTSFLNAVVAWNGGRPPFSETPDEDYPALSFYAYKKK